MDNAKDKIKASSKAMELISQIRKEVFGSKETTPEVFEDVKKVDGTILRVEPSIEVGATVEVIAEDGEMIAAPDGEHELETGQIIATEGGLVVQVLEGEESGDDETEEEMEAAPTLNVEEITAKISSNLMESIIEKVNNMKFANEEQIDDLKAENAVLREENEGIKEGFNKLLDLVQEIADAPTAEPTKKTKQPFAKKGKLKLNDFKL